MIGKKVLGIGKKNKENDNIFCRGIGPPEPIVYVGIRPKAQAED